MSQPGNGFCFSASGRMLDEVVARCMIHNDIVHNTLNGTKLMETRENQHLGFLDFSGICISGFFFLDVNKTLNQEQDFIFHPDVFPHIGNIQAIFVVRISLAEIFANVKWIKECICTFEFGCKIRFVQIHSKGCENTNLGLEKTSGSITLFLILFDGVFVGLTGCVAFKFDGKYRQTVEK